MKKSALITGVSGQDGSYLAEYLIEKNYDVFGTIGTKVTSPDIARILDNITIVDADLTDESSITKALKAHDPGEIYNVYVWQFTRSRRTIYARPLMSDWSSRQFQVLSA